MLKMGVKCENHTMVFRLYPKKKTRKNRNSLQRDWRIWLLSENNKFYLPAVIGVTPTLHRSLPNIELPHNPSLIAIFVIFAPNGGRPCEGNNAPTNFSFFFLFWFSFSKFSQKKKKSKTRTRTNTHRSNDYIVEQNKDNFAFRVHIARDCYQWAKISSSIFPPSRRWKRNSTINSTWKHESVQFHPFGDQNNKIKHVLYRFWKRICVSQCFVCLSDTKITFESAGGRWVFDIKMCECEMHTFSNVFWYKWNDHQHYHVCEFWTNSRPFSRV